MLVKRLWQSLPKTSTLTQNPQIKQLKTAHARSIDRKKITLTVNNRCTAKQRLRTTNDDFSVQGSVFCRIDALLGEFRVGGGVHDSYTFQCGLVGSFTSPGIDTRDRRDRRLLVSPPKDTGKAG